MSEEASHFDSRAAEPRSFQGFDSSDDYDGGWSSDYSYEEDGSDDAEGDTSNVIPRSRVFVFVGTFDTLEEARRAIDLSTSFYYTYETRYRSAQRHARVFMCRSHLSCDHRFKIIEMEASFVLMEGGDHGNVVIQPPRRGIHRSLVGEVDMMLQNGWGPKKVELALRERYKGRVGALNQIPTVKQLENRKAKIMKATEGGWDLVDYATFNAWASSRMCETRDMFESVTDKHDSRMDELIILDTFILDPPDANSLPAFGVILTSRRLFRNVLTACRDQRGEVLCSADGTYKLHFGGWTLVDCGTVAVAWDRNSYVHRFLPWAYMFTRSESTDSYERLFETVKSKARTSTLSWRSPMDPSTTQTL